MMYPLHRFLVDCDMAMLRALAQTRGVPLTSNRQAEAADLLAAALLDPLSIQAALARLSPRAHEALEALLAASGRMRAPQFARSFGQVRPFGPGRLERDHAWQHPANPTEELWYAGLVFRAFHEDEVGPGEFLFVPDDLRSLLPQPRKEPPKFTVTACAPPPDWHDEDPVLVQDMFAYLVYLQTHDVRPYADGRLGGQDLASLQERMIGAGKRRLEFLQHLAGRLGFIGRQGEYLHLETAPVKRWLIATPARRIATLQETWRDDTTWNDLCHVPTLVCDNKAAWRNDPAATRRALLVMLAHCPTDEWWTLASFVAAVKETHPDFQRPDGDYASWYIRAAKTGEYLSGFDSWDSVEGALIEDLLTGPLRWLGVVAAGADKNGQIHRLTRAGAGFLGLAASDVESSPMPPITVDVDFRVEVPAPDNFYVRFQLERFAAPARRQSAGQNLVSSQPCVYQLTAPALGRAQSRGVHVEQVLAFLQQASKGRVPANVAGQLRLWAGRYDQVQLQEVVLLTVKSERALKELSLLPETRSLLGRTISPTSVLIRKKDLPRLRAALQTLGFLRDEEGGKSQERG
jgi:hypothetical protein